MRKWAESMQQRFEDERAQKDKCSSERNAILANMPGVQTKCVLDISKDGKTVKYLTEPLHHQSVELPL